MSQQNRLLKLLLEFEELFDRTLGDWKTEPIKFQLKPGMAPYHGRAFPIPHIHLVLDKLSMKSSLANFSDPKISNSPRKRFFPRDEKRQQSRLLS